MDLFRKCEQTLNGKAHLLCSTMYVLAFQNPSYKSRYNSAQKMKFSSKDFFSKCDQIRRKLRI